jgi:hypothetical protein
MANQQNFEINIANIAAGTRRMNEMKCEINTALKILTPFLARMSYDYMSQQSVHFKDCRNNIVRCAYSRKGCTLAVEANQWENTTNFFVVFLHEDTNKEILHGEVSDNEAINSSAKADCLAKENVANCHELVQQLVSYVERLYPEEFRAAVEPYISLVR